MPSFGYLSTINGTKNQALEITQVIVIGRLRSKKLPAGYAEAASHTKSIRMFLNMLLVSVVTYFAKGTVICMKEKNVVGLVTRYRCGSSATVSRRGVTDND